MLPVMGDAGRCVGEPGSLSSSMRWLVPASLLISFAANDGEEWLTMAGPASDRLPWLFGAGLTQGHVEIAIGMMAVALTLAAWDGWRTAGRGRFIRTSNSSSVSMGSRISASACWPADTPRERSPHRWSCCPSGGGPGAACGPPASRTPRACGAA